MSPLVAILEAFFAVQRYVLRPYLSGVATFKFACHKALITTSISFFCLPTSHDKVRFLCYQQWPSISIKKLFSFQSDPGFIHMNPKQQKSAKIPSSCHGNQQRSRTLPVSVSPCDTRSTCEHCRGPNGSRWYGVWLTRHTQLRVSGRRMTISSEWRLIRISDLVNLLCLLLCTGNQVWCLSVCQSICSFTFSILCRVFCHLQHGHRIWNEFSFHTMFYKANCVFVYLQPSREGIETQNAFHNI